MDLRGTSSSGSRPLPAITIPRARQPLHDVPLTVLSPVGSVAGAAPTAQAGQVRALIRLAEAGTVVVALYVLIGVGIGAVAGSLEVGAVAGLLAGVCAIAAILLIRGSAVSAGRESSTAECLRQALSPR